MIIDKVSEYKSLGQGELAADASSSIRYESLGNGTLSRQFFDQMHILRSSCNDFDGLQNKLALLLNSSK